MDSNHQLQFCKLMPFQRLQYHIREVRLTPSLPIFHSDSFVEMLFLLFKRNNCSVISCIDEILDLIGF